MDIEDILAELDAIQDLLMGPIMEDLSSEQVLTNLREAKRRVEALSTDIALAIDGITG